MTKTRIFLSNDVDKKFFSGYQIWTDARKFYDKSDPHQIEISHDGWPCFHWTDVSGIKQTASPIVLVDCLTEGIHCYPTFLQYPAGKKYLIISGGQWDPEAYPLPFDYQVVSYPFFLAELMDQFLSPRRFNFYANRQYQFSGEKDMIFVCLIGAVKKYRSFLVDRLTQELSYKNYVLKYAGKSLGMPVDDVIDTADFDAKKIIMPEHYLTASFTVPMSMLNRCRFNLIVETDIDLNDQFFLTEKTIKALLCGIPFVIAGTPGFLEQLQRLGFKTFSSLWDETYDLESDHAVRLEKIVELCGYLGSFDWNNHLCLLQDIAEHNKKNFFKINEIVDQSFMSFENSLKYLSIDQ